MSGMVGRMVAVIAGLLGLVAMRALSLVPVGEAPTYALLRLSWSARPERVEVCRELSDAELAERPAHMRLRTQCSGRFASYLLRVQIGDGLVLTDTVRGGGLRNDRPMHLVRDVRVPPGQHMVRVSLARIDSTSAGPGDASTKQTGALGDRTLREDDERRRRMAEALPSSLVLDQQITFEAGRVMMITYSSDRRSLLLMEGGAP